MVLFWDTLFLKVYSATYGNVGETVMQLLLAAPLQCKDHPTFMAFGLKDRPGRLAISVCDFGYFTCEKGIGRENNGLAKNMSRQR